MERSGGSERRGRDVSAGQRAGADRPRTYAAQAASPRGLAERVLVTLSGARQPIVLILMAITFMTVISGKPLDGLLMLVVATALCWDAGMRARSAAVARQVALAGLSGTAPAVPADPADPPAEVGGPDGTGSRGPGETAYSSRKTMMNTRFHQACAPRSAVATLPLWGFGCAGPAERW